MYNYIVYNNNLIYESSYTFVVNFSMFSKLLIWNIIENIKFKKPEDEQRFDD